MADIKEYLKKILSARYGKDVRQSIHDSIEEINNVAESYEDTTKGYMEKAEAASTSASTSATNAKTSETNASASASSASTSAGNAKTSETNAKSSESNAKASETNAKTSETNAKSSESNAKTYASNASTSATNAKTSETNASASAKSASTSATNASASEANAKTSESNASTSATNASTSAKEAKAIAESLDGTIQAMGTITFSELAGKKSTARAGYMWNISDAFTTTSDFKEGAGVSKGAGENVYMTTDGLWDCFAGKDVLSVNDKNGVVSLNAEDIPLSVSGTRYDNATDMKDVVHFISADVQDVAVVASSGAATQGIIAATWSSSTSYAVDDYCTYNDNLWKCKTANKAQTPAEGTYWTSVKVTDEIDTLNQSLANKVNTSALGNAAYKAYTTSVTSGSSALVTSGGVYTRLNTQLGAVKIVSGIDTQLQKASALNTEYVYTISLSSYGFKEVPRVFLMLQRGGYTGMTYYQIHTLTATQLQYIVKFTTDMTHVDSSKMHWIAIGKY